MGKCLFQTTVMRTRLPNYRHNVTANNEIQFSDFLQDATHKLRFLILFRKHRLFRAKLSFTFAVEQTHDETFENCKSSWLHCTFSGTYRNAVTFQERFQEQRDVLLRRIASHFFKITWKKNHSNEEEDSWKPAHQGNQKENWIRVKQENNKQLSVVLPTWGDVRWQLNSSFLTVSLLPSR